MELVYLWVEDYKNIEKQGFNFSPRFECEFKYEYDDNGKLNNNSKLIVITKKYKNIFPSTINITAITGENGSGKSSIIKLIFLLIFYKKIEIGTSTNSLSTAFIKQNYTKNLFLIIKDDSGKLKKISYNNNYYLTDYNEIEDINFFSMYFNYILDSWYQDYGDNWVNGIYHRKDNYLIPLLSQPNKHNSNTLANSIDIDMMVYLNSKRLLQFYSDINNNTSISNFFKPTKIRIKKSNFGHTFSVNGDSIVFDKTDKLASHLFRVCEKFKLQILDNKILNELRKLEDTSDFTYMNQLYITFKILISSENSINPEIFSKTKQGFEDMIKNNTLISKTDTVQIYEFKNLFTKQCSDYEVLKIKNAIEFQKEKKHSDINFEKLYNLNYLNLEDEKVKKILDFIPPWIDIEFYEGEKTLASLSSGEKALFTIILNLMYQVNNLIQEEKYNSINIFLDETELGLHPNWQKQYLKNIIDSIIPLNKDNKPINLILATHSPFIISDLPKENVLFLEEGRQKYPFKDKQTFGANIHTLLSDGFFMSDGLMGEFAKGKIEEIKKLYETVKFFEQKIKEKQKPFIYIKLIYLFKIKKFKHIKSIIGEPFLQTVIKNYLDELEILFNGKKEFLDKEIKRLQDLRADQND